MGCSNRCEAQFARDRCLLGIARGETAFLAGFRELLGGKARTSEVPGVHGARTG